MCIHMHKYHTITHMHTHAYTQRTHVCMCTLQACMLTYRSHTYTDYMRANVQTHTHLHSCTQTTHTHTYPCLFDGETNFSPLSPASTLQCVFSAAQSMVNSANTFSALGILLAQSTAQSVCVVPSTYTALNPFHQVTQVIAFQRYTAKTKALCVL